MTTRIAIPSGYRRLRVGWKRVAGYRLRLGRRWLKGRSSNIGAPITTHDNDLLGPYIAPLRRKKAKK